MYLTDTGLSKYEAAKMLGRANTLGQVYLYVGLMQRHIMKAL